MFTPCGKWYCFQYAIIVCINDFILRPSYLNILLFKIDPFKEMTNQGKVNMLSQSSTAVK